MKKAIIDAGLETEDLVERSHVEERYEEALALQPREVDQSSSKAKGMAQAAALKNKPKAEPKARPAAPNESGWWRMEDLSKAFKKYSEDPSAPEANYFMGKALQMAGQADQADEQYSLFYDRCVAIHQNRDKALKFYEQAHAAGHANATCNLGVLYSSGDGVEQNKEKAVKLYALSYTHLTLQTKA